MSTVPVATVPMATGLSTVPIAAAVSPPLRVSRDGEHRQCRRRNSDR